MLFCTYPVGQSSSTRLVKQVVLKDTNGNTIDADLPMIFNSEGGAVFVREHTYLKVWVEFNVISKSSSSYTECGETFTNYTYKIGEFSLKAAWTTSVSCSRESSYLTNVSIGRYCDLYDGSVQFGRRLVSVSNTTRNITASGNSVKLASGTTFTITDRTAIDVYNYFNNLVITWADGSTKTLTIQNSGMKYNQALPEAGGTFRFYVYQGEI